MSCKSLVFNTLYWISGSGPWTALQEAVFESHRVMTRAMKSIFKLGTIILAASLAFAGKPKIAKDLRGMDPNSNVDVIVQFNQTLQEKHIDKM